MDNSPIPEYLFGSLPARATLASAYVPMQVSAEPHYEPQSAIARGTLFPGLDLPFRGMVNRPLPDGELGELMAIEFVADELELYLDTHCDDKEAFDMYQTVLALVKEARERFVDKVGPLCQRDLLGMKTYRWLCDPWPWEWNASKEV